VIDDLLSNPDFMGAAIPAYIQATRDMIGPSPVFKESVAPEPEVVWEQGCDSRKESFASFWRSHKAVKTIGTHVRIETFSGMALPTDGSPAYGIGRRNVVKLDRNLLDFDGVKRGNSYYLSVFGRERYRSEA
jgi:hypothetical protein